MLSFLLLLACAPKDSQTNTKQETPVTNHTTIPKDSDIAVQDKNFSAPESVLYDKHNDRYLVSNINGKPTAKDANGFISVVTPNGKVTNAKWIDGSSPEIELHAPKGMAIVEQRLFVTDIDAVRVFDLSTGQQEKTISIPGAKFLNDIAANPSHLYVSDMKTNTIHKISPNGTNEPLISATELNSPNGLAIRGQELIVVSFSGNQVHTLTMDGAIKHTDELPTGSLDGVILQPDGTALISSWDGDVVYQYKAGAQTQAILPNIKSPADIGWDSKRNRLLVPMLKENQIWIHNLSAKK